MIRTGGVRDEHAPGVHETRGESGSRTPEEMGIDVRVSMIGNDGFLVRGEVRPERLRARGALDTCQALYGAESRGRLRARDTNTARQHKRTGAIQCGAGLT